MCNSAVKDMLRYQADDVTRQKQQEYNRIALNSKAKYLFPKRSGELLLASYLQYALNAVPVACPLMISCGCASNAVWAV